MSAQPPPGGVVIEHKKGEVNELKASLRNPGLDRDPDKKREVIKRVIAYMTLGIDVSKLFSEMIMASASKDHVVKKMVYLYITTYATSNPELSLLAINTLQKDCRDEDPVTRGLALRSFTSLRLESTKEYLPAVITAGLKDMSPYVRKTAVIACIKLQRLAPEALVQGDTVNTLYNMLRDRDAQVVSNCICALNEILQHEGGMAINKPIIHHLLNRMKEFNEWAQVRHKHVHGDCSCACSLSARPPDERPSPDLTASVPSASRAAVYRAGSREPLQARVSARDL